MQSSLKKQGGGGNVTRFFPWNCVSDGGRRE